MTDFMKAVRDKFRWRRLRKIARSDVRIDIPVSAYFKHQVNMMKKTFNLSKFESHNQIQEMISALVLVRYLSSIQSMPTKDIDIETLYLITSVTILPSARMADSLMLLDNSILLAVSGNYTAAHALLRLSYESLIVGGFYNVISFDTMNMIPIVRDYKGRDYPKSFGDIVEDTMRNITSEEEHIRALVLESRLENFLQEHKPKLLPPNFKKMLRQVCEFYGLITPKYRNFCYELYGDLSNYIHTSQNASYHLKDWKEGLVFSKEQLQDFSTRFLTVLDVLGYLYNVIMAGGYTLPGVVSHVTKVMTKFKDESESLPLTNLIVRELCKQYSNRTFSEIIHSYSTEVGNDIQ